MVHKARWIWIGDAKTGHYECSHCHGRPLDTPFSSDYEDLSDVCPHCNANMIEIQDPPEEETKLEHDLDSTNLSIIILMAKKIEELKDGINADDKELFTTLATQIRELANDNFELRKQLKTEKKLNGELRRDNANMMVGMEKAQKWKKGLNDYRKKYELLRYGYTHGTTDSKKEETYNGT